MHYYQIQKHRNLWLDKNDHTRHKASCYKSCPWMVYAYRMDDGFQVRMLMKEDEHKCMLTSNIRVADTKWLAKTFEDYFKLNLETTRDSIINFVFCKTQINVN